jgi:uncharacterized RDD family membrane protein YckC
VGVHLDVDTDQSPQRREDYSNWTWGGGTSETVDLSAEHEVNNLGRRIAATMCDLFGLALIFFLFLIFWGQELRFKGGGASPVSHSVRVPGIGGPALLAYIATCFLYFILFEWVLRFTPGKLLFSLRVVNMAEERISFRQSLVRNLLRAYDGLPYVLPYMMGYASVRISRNHQRWGDRMAGTIVIDSA